MPKRPRDLSLRRCRKLLPHLRRSLRSRLQRRPRVQPFLVPGSSIPMIATIRESGDKIQVARPVVEAAAWVAGEEGWAGVAGPVVEAEGMAGGVGEAAERATKSGRKCA